MTSTQREQFVSEKFVIGQITWQLIGYPMYDNGTFQLYLRPMHISSDWSKIIVSATLYCTETICGDASIFTFNKKQLYRAQPWSPGCISISEIKDRKLHSLSLSVTVTILQILSISSPSNSPPSTSNTSNSHSHSGPVVVYEHTTDIDAAQSDEVQRIEWELSSITLREVQRSSYGKCFISFVHSMFCLKIFPNGYQKEGLLHVEIQWKGLPPQLNNKLLHWTLTIPETGVATAGSSRFGYNNSSVHCPQIVVSLETLQKLNRLSIHCHIAPFPLPPPSTTTAVTTRPPPPTRLPPPPPVQVGMIPNTMSNTMPNTMPNTAPNVMSTQSLNDNSTVISTQNDDHSELGNVSSICHNMDALNVAVQRNQCDIRSIYQQFSATMGKVHAEMELIKKTMNMEHRNNQQCISQLTQQIMILNQTQHQHHEILAAMKRVIGNGVNGVNNHSITTGAHTGGAVDEQKTMSEITSNHGVRDHGINDDDGVTEEIRLWLTVTMKMPQYLPLFIRNGYDDMEIVREMTDSELSQIGIDKIGHRKKMLKYLHKMDHQSGHQHDHQSLPLQYANMQSANMQCGNSQDLRPPTPPITHPDSARSVHSGVTAHGYGHSAFEYNQNIGNMQNGDDLNSDNRDHSDFNDMNHSGSSHSDDYGNDLNHLPNDIVNIGGLSAVDNIVDEIVNEDLHRLSIRKYWETPPSPHSMATRSSSRTASGTVSGTKGSGSTLSESDRRQQKINKLMQNSLKLNNFW